MVGEQAAVLVAGGTGSIGQRLVPELVRQGYRVRLLVRAVQRARQLFPHGVELYRWDTRQTIPGEALAGVWGVVNLVGVPIARRWTAAYRREILQSRVDATRALAEAICRLQDPRPAVFLSVSATGYYGNKGEELCTEETAPGEDFLAQVCQHWEAAAQEAAPCTRVVIPRLAAVLDRRAGLLARLLPTFRSFLGGSIGTGQQWVPWVHWHDVVSFMLWALQSPTVKGVYNLAAPEPVRYRQLCEALGRQLRRPCWLRIPVWALRIAYGALADALCASQRVVPRRAIAEGFSFRFAKLQEALQYELAQGT